MFNEEEVAGLSGEAAAADRDLPDLPDLPARVLARPLDELADHAEAAPAMKTSSSSAVRASIFTDDEVAGLFHEAAVIEDSSRLPGPGGPGVAHWQTLSAREPAAPPAAPPARFNGLEAASGGGSSRRSRCSAMGAYRAVSGSSSQVLSSLVGGAPFAGPTAAKLPGRPVAVPITESAAPSATASLALAEAAPEPLAPMASSAATPALFAGEMPADASIEQELNA